MVVPCICMYLISTCPYGYKKRPCILVVHDEKQATLCINPAPHLHPCMYTAVQSHGVVDFSKISRSNPKRKHMFAVV